MNAAIEYVIGAGDKQNAAMTDDKAQDFAVMSNSSPINCNQSKQKTCKL